MEQMLACCQTAEAGRWRRADYKLESGFVKVLGAHELIKVIDRIHYALEFQSVMLDLWLCDK